MDISRTQTKVVLRSTLSQGIRSSKIETGVRRSFPNDQKEIRAMAPDAG
jgi:hypothetical protein